jgi:hypothetical protein|eukprot:SAG25_NODE_751_length_5572_cov_4.487484_4_plen_173_part_00
MIPSPSSLAHPMCKLAAGKMKWISEQLGEPLANVSLAWVRDMPGVCSTLMVRDRCTSTSAAPYIQQPARDVAVMSSPTCLAHPMHTLAAGCKDEGPADQERRLLEAPAQPNGNGTTSQRGRGREAQAWQQSGPVRIGRLYENFVVGCQSCPYDDSLTRKFEEYTAAIVLLDT